MDIIKASPAGVEFDVLYDDGTKHHVCEGILFEVTGEEVIFHNGTNRLSVLFAASEASMETIGLLGLAKVFAHHLYEGAESCFALPVINQIVETFGFSSEQNKATFRLGQMDMKQSIVDMLRDVSDVRASNLRPGLSLAASMVESMEVPDADT